jgi:hypothetical protein
MAQKPNATIDPITTGRMLLAILVWSFMIAPENSANKAFAILQRVALSVHMLASHLQCVRRHDDVEL